MKEIRVPTLDDAAKGILLQRLQSFLARPWSTKYTENDFEEIADIIKKCGIDSLELFDGDTYRSVLHIVSYHCNFKCLEAIESILTRTFNPTRVKEILDHPSKHGTRACHYAAALYSDLSKDSNESQLFLRRLFAIGDIDVNPCNESGYTPLYQAASSSNHLAVTFFLEKNANQDLRVSNISSPAYLMTALDAAVVKGFEACVEAFINFAIESSTVISPGTLATALDYAEKNLKQTTCDDDKKTSGNDDDDANTADESDESERFSNIARRLEEYANMEQVRQKFAVKLKSA